MDSACESEHTAVVTPMSRWGGRGAESQPHPKIASPSISGSQGGLESRLVVQALSELGNRISALERCVAELSDVLRRGQPSGKEWYTTTELAVAMGKSQYTIQEHWCNDARIECGKDPESGKWRIPGHEYQRLVAGGALRPKRK
jgi:hypothetical protein